MTTDRDLIREFLTAEFREPEPDGDIRTLRAPYEGAANSPAICAGCGFSLTDPGRCPKCGCIAREIATAFVRRDLSKLLVEAQAEKPSRGVKPAPPKPPKAAPRGSPAAIARATGFAKDSKDYKRIYHRAYVEAERRKGNKH